jgi:hypothetical protein
MFPIFEGSIPISTYPLYPKMDPKEPVYKKLKIIEKEKNYDKGKKVFRSIFVHSRINGK